MKSVTLGIVQGLTEFLPISSSAHLKIVPNLLGWPDPGTAATAVIQLGTIAAVLLYFRRDLWDMTRGFLGSLRPGADRSSLSARLGWAVVVGTIPVAALGLLLKHFIETSFRSLYVSAAMLIGMAVLLALAETLAQHRRALRDIQVRDGWIVGMAQALALIPGASRSGSTLTGALFIGLERSAAARFSFLLSVPAVVLSGLFELKDVLRPSAPPPPGMMHWTTPDLLIATVISGVVGYAAIAWLLRYLQQHTTTVFIVYRIVLGIALIALLATGFLHP